MADVLADLSLVTHKAVVESLPSAIREDFREAEAGELWKLPPVAVYRWGEREPIAVVQQ